MDCGPTIFCLGALAAGVLSLLVSSTTRELSVLGGAVFEEVIQRPGLVSRQHRRLVLRPTSPSPPPRPSQAIRATHTAHAITQATCGCGSSSLCT